MREQIRTGRYTNTNKTHMCAADRFSVPKILSLLRLLSEPASAAHSRFDPTAASRTREVGAVWDVSQFDSRVEVRTGFCSPAANEATRLMNVRIAAQPLNMNTHDASVKQTHAGLVAHDGVPNHYYSTLKL